jgi:2-keto-4-pentenoate hydratase/2-oxohepta-3-ene-1,7-dioic acid hydratase in catechol pathway
MRIVRFEDSTGATRLGHLVADGEARIVEGSLFEHRATDRIEKVARLLAPVQPVNIYCIGANYAAHARESGAPIPDNPVVFMKPTTAVTDPGDPIRIPRCCRVEGEVDYEGELAVVIGRPGRDIAEDQALQYVLGYTCAHDVSARHWQKQGGGGQWVRGKSFDTFCPLGPILVTADEVGDPQSLRIRTTVSGKILQNSHTGDMIFSVARLIAFLSRDTTLLPGTIILTGTPEGVGAAQKPQRWLRPGDQVTVDIPGIGSLSNPVIAAPAPTGAP